MTKSLQEMTAEIRAVNTEKGWRVVKNPWGDYVALLHSEITEMLEAYRDHRLADATGTATFVRNAGVIVRDENGNPITIAKPEGVGSEAADVLIRLLDMADVYGLRAYDMDCELADVDPVYPGSGAPSSFGGWCAWLHRRASDLYQATGEEPNRTAAQCDLPIVLRALVAFTARWEIDLQAEYERKIAYSWTRPYQHGGRTLADSGGTS